MTENLCRCTRPTRGPAYVVCETCADNLAKALGDVTWLDEELEVTITGQKGVDYRTIGGSGGGKKDAERPSPVNWGPAEARGSLRDILVSWTRLCVDDGVRNSSPYPGLPDDNLQSIAGWLLWRVDGLTLHAAGSDAVEEIVKAVAHCHRVIDRPADRQYLGNCHEQDCNGRMYARPGSEMARCNNCYTTVNANEIRKQLLAELNDRICTAAEIAHLSTYLGFQADRTQVRKRINHWAARDQIEVVPSFSDETTFRFGDVYDKLVEYEDDRAKKSA